MHESVSTSDAFYAFLPNKTMLEESAGLADGTAIPHQPIDRCSHTSSPAGIFTLTANANKKKEKLHAVSKKSTRVPAKGIAVPLSLTVQED